MGHPLLSLMPLNNYSGNLWVRGLSSPSAAKAQQSVSCTKGISFHFLLSFLTNLFQPWMQMCAPKVPCAKSVNLPGQSSKNNFTFPPAP